MADNTLLVHMGRHKTGTTALQSFLSENREKLEEYGWCYPDFKKELPELQVWPPWQTEKNGTNFFFTKGMKHGERILWERGELCTHTTEWDRIWEWISECLKHKNLIVSEEALWYVADEFLEEAKKKYGNIKVLIYIRRQDRAMESWWNQMVKGGRWCHKTFREYLDSDGISEIQEGLHYLKKLNQVSRRIGKENCIVRVYEEQQLLGELGVISDFFSVLGFIPDWGCWKRSLNRNTRLSGNYIEIKRALNSIRLDGYFPSEGIVSVFGKLSEKAGKGEIGYFNVAERKEFMRQFESENERIAKEYLHREDGILFYDDRMDYPLDDIHPCNSFEENLIQAFSAMLCFQQEEIFRLKKRDYVLTWKLLLQKTQGRKIIFFGAGEKCKELMKHVTIPVTYIVDNDPVKAGSWKIEGVKVIHPQEIHDWSLFLVVVTCVKTDEIEGQLQKLGLKKEEDYVVAGEYFT